MFLHVGTGRCMTVGWHEFWDLQTIFLLTVVAVGSIIDPIGRQSNLYWNTALFNCQWYYFLWIACFVFASVIGQPGGPDSDSERFSWWSQEEKARGKESTLLPKGFAFRLGRGKVSIAPSGTATVYFFVSVSIAKLWAANWNLCTDFRKPQTAERSAVPMPKPSGSSVLSRCWYIIICDIMYHCIFLGGGGFF